MGKKLEAYRSPALRGVVAAQASRRICCTIVQPCALLLCTRQCLSRTTSALLFCRLGCAFSDPNCSKIPSFIAQRHLRLRVVYRHQEMDLRALAGDLKALKTLAGLSGRSKKRPSKCTNLPVPRYYYRIRIFDSRDPRDP